MKVPSTIYTELLPWLPCFHPCPHTAILSRQHEPVRSSHAFAQNLAVGLHSEKSPSPYNRSPRSTPTLLWHRADTFPLSHMATLTSWLCPQLPSWPLFLFSAPLSPFPLSGSHKCPFLWPPYLFTYLFIFLFYFLKLFILYWSIVDNNVVLVSAKRFCYTYTWTYSFSNSFPI